MPKGGHTRDALEDLFFERKLKPRYIMELDSSELLKRFVAADAGIGFMARSNVLEDVRANALTAVPISDATIRRDLALVFRKDKSLSRAARRSLILRSESRVWMRLRENRDRDPSSREPAQFPLLAFAVFADQQRSRPNWQACSQRTPRLGVCNSSPSKSQEASATNLKISPPRPVCRSAKPCMRTISKGPPALLGDSGAFSDVAFSFDYSAKGTKVEFQVKDSPELCARRGSKTSSGFQIEISPKSSMREFPSSMANSRSADNLVDQVSLALQAMLIEEKVEGRADYIRVGAEGGPTEAFDFSVTGRHITIRDVQFQGADPSLLPVLQTAAKELSGKEYARDAIRAAAEKNFLRFYFQRGYLKAALGDPEARVVKKDPEETRLM